MSITNVQVSFYDETPRVTSSEHNGRLVATIGAPNEWVGSGVSIGATPENIIAIGQAMVAAGRAARRNAEAAVTA